MNDEYLIQRALNFYSQEVSRGNWDEVLAAYLPDAVWEVPHINAKFEGREAIRSAMVQFSSAMDYVLQTNSPAVIEIDGDTATARSGIRECGKFAGRDEAFEFLGLYADKLVRTADGWKFAERVFEHLGSNISALLPTQQQ